MKKYILIAFAFAAVLFSSCQREMAKYSYAADCAGVTFPSEERNIEMLAEDGNKVVIEMNRGNVKGAVSIPVTITDYTQGVFTPEKSSFDFKDGEATAYITFKYPSIEDFGAETYSIDIEITDETALKQLAMTGIEKITVNAVRKLTEVYLGTGLFADPILMEDSWKQDIYTFEEAPKTFFLKSCFADGVNINFNVDKGVFTCDETIDTGLAYSAAAPQYGNFGIRKAQMAYAVAETGEKMIVIGGILCLPAIGYDFTTYVVGYALPEGFDVKKYFGIE